MRLNPSPFPVYNILSPQVHNDQCCVDTLPREEKTSAAINVTVKESEVGEDRAGGRGLCFRHAYQRFSQSPNREALGEADAIYFGSGLHLLHMCRRGHGLEAPRVQG